MAIYGSGFTVHYVAWDNANSVGKTGDSANHTLRWIKSGTSAAPSNAASEVDSTNAPGVYKVTLTAAECQTLFGTLCGKSSTADVSIVPVHVAFEYIPNVAAGANGGLPLGDASGRVTVGALANDSITAAALNADAVTEIQSGLATASALATVAGYLDTEIAAILADTNELQTDWADGGRLDLLLDGRATPANVLTQVNAALDTAIAELSAGTPAVTPSMRTALMLMYMHLRNDSEDTQALRKIKNDAGTVIAQGTIDPSSSTGVAQGKLGAPS
jgi:hypothetical protein